MDTDGDGMLTAKEFKIGLKRLQYKSIKEWSLRLVRRLFDECDKNKDGLLSIKEFTNYVQDIESEAVDKAKKPSTASVTSSSSKANKSGDSGKDNTKWDVSDEEEDGFIKKNRALTDHQLMRKVCTF